MSILSNAQGLLFSEILVEESKELQATTLQGWFGAQQSGQAKALVSGAVVACRGVVTHTVNDAVLSSFPDAAAALKAALEIQSRLAAAKKTPGMNVRVRIALAYGPLRVLAGKVSGDAVEAAGLLLDKAKPGEILADQSLKDALGSSSPVKFTPYRKVGERTAFLVGDAPISAMQEVLAKTMERTQGGLAPSATATVPPVKAAPPPRAAPPAPPPAPRPAAVAKPAAAAEPELGAEETVLARPQRAAAREISLTHSGSTQRFTRKDGEIHIGRSQENHIRVDVGYVSRKHAKIVWEADGPVLVNLSAAGCCVKFDATGGRPEPCAERLPLHGSGAFALASLFGQSPSGLDVVKFAIAS